MADDWTPLLGTNPYYYGGIVDPEQWRRPRRKFLDENADTGVDLPGSTWRPAPGMSAAAAAGAVSEPASAAGGYWDLDAWHKWGVKDSDIFDKDGQIRPGWHRTARGYESDVHPEGPFPVYEDIPTSTPGPTSLDAWSSAPTAFDWPSYAAPSYIDVGPFDPGPAFTYADFVGPNPADVTKDPSFQFRYDQGLKALSANRAGRGTFLSGETGKALQDYGQNAASQEYSNIWNRATQTYDTNRNNAFGNWAAQYGQRKDVYGFKADEAGRHNLFNQSNAQFDWSGKQQQALAQFNDLFNRWKAGGDWLSTLASGTE